MLKTIFRHSNEIFECAFQTGDIGHHHDVDSNIDMTLSTVRWMPSRESFLTEENLGRCSQWPSETLCWIRTSELVLNWARYADCNTRRVLMKFASTLWSFKGIQLGVHWPQSNSPQFRAIQSNSSAISEQIKRIKTAIECQISPINHGDSQFVSICAS